MEKQSQFKPKTKPKQTQSNPILSAVASAKEDLSTSVGLVFLGIFHLATAVFFRKFLVKANTSGW
jgi:hypothetical protein